MRRETFNLKVPSPVADWTAAADELISAGVTRINRAKVAAVLAELAHGTAPSTVARRVGVGYATVRVSLRISVAGMWL